jgi:cytochrome c biogenesis protein CcmG/thiol:disulfide interchange protein DsbE
MSRRRFALPCALALAALSTSCGPGTMPPSMPHPLDGVRAPAFEGVSTLDRDVGVPGRALTKVTVVDFWASWCDACQVSLPALDDLWQRHRHDGLMVIGVSVDEHEDDATAAMQRLHASFPVLLDPAQRLATRYGVAQIPLTFVIDRAGNVRWVGREPSEARRAAEVLLAE